MQGISDAYFGLRFSELAFEPGVAVYLGEGVKPAEISLTFDRPSDYSRPAVSQGHVSVSPGHLAGEMTDLVIRTGRKGGNRFQYSVPDGRLICARVGLGGKLAYIDAALVGAGFALEGSQPGWRKYSGNGAVAELEKSLPGPVILDIGLAGDNLGGHLMPELREIFEKIDPESYGRIGKLFG